MTDEDKGDLLWGAEAIGEFLNLTRNQVFHLHRRGRLPTWKEGAIVCARKSTLTKWMAGREAGSASAITVAWRAGDEELKTALDAAAARAFAADTKP